MLDVDTVIAAIGQRCAPAGFESITLTRKGTIEADERSCATNLEGVFAAGDATNKGASIAIRAIAEADDAALAIDAYLCGLELDYKEPFYSKRNVTEKDFADREKDARAVMSVKAPEYRRGNFESVINGFTEEQARHEAARCLECGCHDYHECRLIRYAQQQEIHPERFDGAKNTHETERRLVCIERDNGKCILCGLCVRVCDEVAKQGILGLVGRGFPTAVKPEFRSPETIRICAECGKCAAACPTGALRLIPSGSEASCT
jgi:formate dehydrogenase major subunit